jgi:hypothetical protein
MQPEQLLGRISGRMKRDGQKTRSLPDTMPKGGWIRDVPVNENWRTTTIVQRHRDRTGGHPPL